MCQDSGLYIQIGPVRFLDFSSGRNQSIDQINTCIYISVSMYIVCILQMIELHELFHAQSPTQLNTEKRKQVWLMAGYLL
jgi:hypothetical protein